MSTFQPSNVKDGRTSPLRDCRFMRVKPVLIVHTHSIMGLSLQDETVRLSQLNGLER